MPLVGSIGLPLTSPGVLQHAAENEVFCGAEVYARREKDDFHFNLQPPAGFQD